MRQQRESIYNTFATLHSDSYLLVVVGTGAVGVTEGGGGLAGGTGRAGGPPAATGGAGLAGAAAAAATGALLLAVVSCHRGQPPLPIR